MVRIIIPCLLILSLISCVHVQKKSTHDPEKTPEISEENPGYYEPELHKKYYDPRYEDDPAFKKYYEWKEKEKE